ncbi:Protein of unknown function [Pyronema omphalodes CBS 100304]|uniref:Uncharacterized protein n=1 Tax=Pyronema omphalodes (strain CBS 100304) TaxID=1076935 RepID=U4LWG2_PYROM|nr:Protein of unknown function [Pyronema omphalodes CBS 100304]
MMSLLFLLFHILRDASIFFLHSFHQSQYLLPKTELPNGSACYVIPFNLQAHRPQFPYSLPRLPGSGFPLLDNNNYDIVKAQEATPRFQSIQA